VAVGVTVVEAVLEGVVAEDKEGVAVFVSVRDPVLVAVCV